MGSLFIQYSDGDISYLSQWQEKELSDLHNSDFKPTKRKEDIYDKIGYKIINIFGGIPDLREAEGEVVATYNSQNIIDILNQRGYLYVYTCSAEEWIDRGFISKNYQY